MSILDADVVAEPRPGGSCVLRIKPTDEEHICIVMTHREAVTLRNMLEVATKSWGGDMALDDRPQPLKSKAD